MKAGRAGIEHGAGEGSSASVCSLTTRRRRELGRAVRGREEQPRRWGLLGEQEVAVRCGGALFGPGCINDTVPLAASWDRGRFESCAPSQELLRNRSAAKYSTGDEAVARWGVVARAAADSCWLSGEADR